MNLKFQNTYVKELSDVGSSMKPISFPDPKWLIVSDKTAKFLDLSLSEETQQQLLNACSGQSQFAGAEPIAQKYTGHQFGHYNPDLGDGRGILLGEVETSTGRWDIHVKGSGQTPYSRSGDGRAVVRSCIREFLASEALAGLGIPTSRALGVYTTGESVQREIIEQGAALIRVCESHIRFGHFEYAFYQQNEDLLKRLVRYTHDYVLPEISMVKTAEHSDSDKALAVLKHATLSTAEMVAKWQAFGFCHGVMNTDNMSILGLTFDYGPFGFLDKYDPSHICNHSDHSGRYAFDEQPGVALWNLNALGHALSPLIEKEKIADVLKQYEPRLLSSYSGLMRAKLGLVTEQDNDRQLLGEFLAIMKTDSSDYTNTWRLLADFIDESSSVSEQDMIDNFINKDVFSKWLNKYQLRLELEPAVAMNERAALMKQHSPKFVLRNYLAQQAIEAAEKGDNSALDKLFEVLKRPFEEQPEFNDYAKLPPDWGQALSISCSS